MEQFKQDNTNSNEGENTNKLSESSLFTAVTQIQRADQILLSGIDFEMGEFQNIREYLIEISGQLFSTLLSKIRDEKNPPKDRLAYLGNLNKLEIIFGPEMFDTLFRDNITNRETLEELERKLKKGNSWWKK